MEYMMVTATVGPVFGIIFMAAFAFGMPVLVTKLTRSNASKEEAKRHKRCKAKTTGNILDLNYNVPPEMRDIHDDHGPTVRMIASYEFFVNGTRYTGRDYIYHLPGQKTVNVLYDPSDPNNNCTPWGRKTNNGTEYIIPLLIVIGIFGFIFLCILGIAACSGSAFR